MPNNSSDSISETTSLGCGGLPRRLVNTKAPLSKVKLHLKASSILAQVVKLCMRQSCIDT